MNFFVQRPIVFNETVAGQVKPVRSQYQIALGVSKAIDPMSGMMVNLTEFDSFFVDVATWAGKELVQSRIQALQSIKTLAEKFCQTQKCYFKELQFLESEQKFLINAEFPHGLQVRQFEILWDLSGAVEKRKVEIEMSAQNEISTWSLPSKVFSDVNQLKLDIETQVKEQVHSIKIAELDSPAARQRLF